VSMLNWIPAAIAVLWSAAIVWFVCHPLVDERVHWTELRAACREVAHLEAELHAVNEAYAALESSLANRLVTEYDQAADHDDEALMLRALGRIRAVDLARGWSAWSHFVDVRTRHLAKARQTMGHLANRELSACWRSWHEMWAARRHALDRMHAALSRLANRHLARGWQAWYTSWAARRAAINNARRPFAHLAHRGQSAGWMCWRRRVAERVRRVANMRSAVAYALRRDHAKGFARVSAQWRARQAALAANGAASLFRVRSGQRAGWRRVAADTIARKRLAQLDGLATEHAPRYAMRDGVRGWRQYATAERAAAAERARRAAEKAARGGKTKEQLMRDAIELATACAKLMIARDAIVAGEARVPDGWLPSVLTACAHKEEGVAKLLLDHSADARVRTLSGRTRCPYRTPPSLSPSA
jgi:hypothetical protein